VEAGEDFIAFSADGLGIKIPIEQLRGRPSFYAFPLPMKLLLPLAEDNVLTLSAKFRGLTQYPAESFHIFSDFAARPYNESATAFYQALPLCVNCFGEILSIDQFRRFLKTIILVTPSNWFHCQDILGVIKALDPHYFDLIGGLHTILCLCISFLLNPNDALAVNASEVIIEIVSVANAELVFSFVNSRIDFLDSLNSNRLIPILVKIMQKIGPLPFFRTVLMRLVEIVSFWEDHIGISTAVLQFVTQFDLTGIDPEIIAELRLMAFAQVSAILLHFSGSHVAVGVNRARMDAVHQFLIQSLESKESDFLIFPSLSPALAFLTASQTFDSLFTKTLVSTLLLIAPEDVTAYVLMELPSLQAHEICDLFGTAVAYLGINPNVELAADWCSLLLAVPNENLIDLRDIAIAVFLPIICWAWEHSEAVSDRCLSTFQRFIRQFELSEQDLPPPPPSRESQFSPGLTRPEPQVVDLPRVYTFTPITETMLSTAVIEFASPLLLTQLRFKLLTFSGEQLKQLIAEGATRARPEEVFLLLQDFIRRGFALHSLESIDFSELGFTDLIGLLRRSTNHGIFLTLKNWETATVILSFPQRVKALRDLPRIKNGQLLPLLKSFGLVHAIDRARLIDLCVNCLHTAKIEGVIALVGNVVSSLADLPDDFLESTLESFRENLAFLPLYGISQLLLRIISRFRTGTELPTLAHALLARADLYGPPHARLLEALLVVDTNVADVHSVTASLLASAVPSFFRCGVQLAARVVSELSASGSREPLRAHFAVIFARIQSYERLEPVISLLAAPLASIVRDSEFDRLRTLTLKTLPRFLWRPSDPSFVRFTPLFVAVLSSLDPATPLWREVAELTGVAAGPWPLLRVALACLSERIEVAPEELHHAALAMEAFVAWLADCEADCYSLSNALHEWAVLLEQFCGVEETLMHLCVTVARQVPRFFPYFAAVMRFCTENSGEEGIPRALEGGAEMHPQGTRREAFRIAAATGDYARALRLVQADG
jgi:hypothetical protein